MTTQVTAYSMLNVAATLDGRIVIGFFDGDAVVVEQVDDTGTGLVGADGSGIFSQSASRAATITLRLQHTSPAHKQLLEKWAVQRSGRIIGFPFDVVDGLSNEGGSTPKAFIQSAAGDTKAEEASVREWVLWTSDWTPLIPELVVA